MTKTKTHKELHTGLNGSGHVVFIVVTVVSETGDWKHIEKFDNECEATHWMKWA